MKSNTIASMKQQKKLFKKSKKVTHRRFPGRVEKSLADLDASFPIKKSTKFKELVFSERVVFTVSGFLFLVLALRFYNHMVDDAFISFRYAKNLVNGYGLVFNPGERVEGYTNFLWVIIASISFIVSLAPETTSRIIGLIASLGTLGVVIHYSPKSTNFPHLIWVAPIFLVVHPAFTVWATGGMETPLFTFLMTWGTLWSADQLQKDEVKIISALPIAFAALTRPEGVLVAVVIGVAILLFSHQRISKRLSWSLMFLTIFLPYFFWRWSYYGFIFPNTFYTKVGFEGSQVIRGLRYTYEFFYLLGYWLLPLYLGLLWNTNRRFIFLPLSIMLIFILYIVAIGGDGLPMYRFFVPIVGLFFVLMVCGLKSLLIRYADKSLIQCIVWLMFIIGCVYSALPAFTGPAFNYVQQDIYEVGSWKQIGQWFREHANTDDTIAVIPAGAIPYFSGLRAIDMLGLNDLTIGHKKITKMGSGQAGHEKFDVDYVLQRAPDYILIGVYGLSQKALSPDKLIFPYYEAEKQLLHSPIFQQNYYLTRVRTRGGYFAYFVKKDSESTVRQAE